MVILGIDYGQAKTGLALSSGTLAYPLKVINESNIEKLIREIKTVAAKEGVAKIVVGISEGDMGKKQRDFVGKIAKEFAVPVETWDETLTTQEALHLARESGISRNKLARMEDAFAATVMLQSYLDTKYEAKKKNSKNH